MGKEKYKIAVINGGNTGSTGKIMYGIGKQAINNGFEYKTFSPWFKNEKKGIEYHTFLRPSIERKICRRINYFTGSLDSLNYFSTKYLIKKLDEYKPDIIHLHNLHGNYLNLQMLFSYIKKSNIKIVWTLHDCWSFTGECSHFESVNCNKWQNYCNNCPQISAYPETRIDSSKRLFFSKEKMFSDLKNCTIVTPSEWLKSLTEKSYLNQYKIITINNGVNLDVFHPKKSNIRSRYSLENSFIILGVSPIWSYSKGIDRFNRLAEVLPNECKIVLIGSKADITINKKIIYIGRTSSIHELVEWYSSADVLLNPTREDTFPTVNLESLACGTPVLTYGACGSAEAINAECGNIINDNNVLDVLEQLEISNFSMSKCLQRAHDFDENKKYESYIKIYKSILDA